MGEPDKFPRKEAEQRLLAALRGARIVGHQPRTPDTPKGHDTLPPVGPRSLGGKDAQRKPGKARPPK